MDRSGLMIGCLDLGHGIYGKASLLLMGRAENLFFLGNLGFLQFRGGGKGFLAFSKSAPAYHLTLSALKFNQGAISLISLYDSAFSSFHGCSFGVVSPHIDVDLVLFPEFIL